MYPELTEILACPACRAELHLQEQEVAPDGDVLAGQLACAGCGNAYPIVNGIPRFVPSEAYAASFGYQWNRFRTEQVDTLQGKPGQSRRRLFAETGWSREGLRGKWVLDAGCGAGRFLDVIADTGCHAVGVDISSAVDAARANMAGRRNVHLVQASLYELPFREGAFDACYCIGVVQHTPDPAATLRALPRILRPGGDLAVTIYERKHATLLNTKYLVRPLTRRMNKRLLLGAIRLTMPVVFPLTEVLFRLPVVGRAFQFGIPVANYVRDPDLTLKQRYQWAVLDTFDMLSPRFDQPQRESDVCRVLQEEGIEAISRLGNPGLNVIGRRRVSTGPAPARQNA
jgi:SAM-dependent methyltransferase